MSMTLNQVELRVLGVLIEKSMSQPAGYPLTLNAVSLGANQKQNRDPVVEFAEADIARAVHTLQTKDLVKQSAPSSGARVNRFELNVVQRFQWDRRDQAIMAELMLRGHQTAGELRTRASRMTSIPDLPAALSILTALASHDPPFVEELPREPGRSTNRFRHLLSSEPAAEEPVPQNTETIAPKPGDTDAALPERVGKLEAKVTQLALVVEELQKSVAATIDRSGGSSI